LSPRSGPHARPAARSAPAADPVGRVGPRRPKRAPPANDHRQGLRAAAGSLAAHGARTAPLVFPDLQKTAAVRRWSLLPSARREKTLPLVRRDRRRIVAALEQRFSLPPDRWCAADRSPGVGRPEPSGASRLHHPVPAVRRGRHAAGRVRRTAAALAAARSHRRRAAVASGHRPRAARSPPGRGLATAFRGPSENQPSGAPAHPHPDLAQDAVHASPACACPPKGVCPRRRYAERAALRVRLGSRSLRRDAAAAQAACARSSAAAPSSAPMTTAGAASCAAADPSSREVAISSRGGSSCSERRPRSSRKARVVA